MTPLVSHLVMLPVYIGTIWLVRLAWKLWREQ